MAKSFMILCLFIFSACTDSQDAKTEPVFQGQIDSLNKAKTLENKLIEADQQQRQRINEQSN